MYKQFAGDFNKLDSTFHTLKKQLPVNPNREQILEAMIQNLQYQEALLNQQLNIIKKINNTKKEAYENAFYDKSNKQLKIVAQNEKITIQKSTYRLFT